MGMEGFLAKLIILAAGILLSSALVLTGCGQAAPDCKTSTADPVCAKAAQLATAAKASPAAKASATPKPRPEPQVVGRPVPAKNKQASTRKSQQQPLTRQTARHSPPHRTYARAQWNNRRESRRDWNAYDERRDGREYRPPPAYESAPGPVAGGCDDACQYRAWFERYSAWYDRYGRTYKATPRSDMREAAPPPYGSAYRHDDRLSLGTGQHPDQSERDRLAPWHGYNPSDGPENGY